MRTVAIILGIETSCDDTGVAIYTTDKGLIANVIYSQISLHDLYGGVVPELASRDHIRRITPLLSECFQIAGINKQDIDAVAYTYAPGLNGALLIGASVANGLAFSLNKPVIPIHHLEGHILSTFLSEAPPKPPFIALLVSGGHTQIIQVDAIGKYKLLGDTLDDAAGEAFDKTAKMLGLPYPGGKYIAELAINGQDVYKLPRPMQHSGDLNMSFSGLKTAVAILIKRLKHDSESLLLLKKQIVPLDYKMDPGLRRDDKVDVRDDGFRSMQPNLLPLNITQDIAKSVEEAITDILVQKAVTACKQTGINKLVVSGGVSANITLRRKLDQNPMISTFYPPLELCTDSGAMIAIAGHTRFQSAKFDYSFDVKPRLALC